MGADFNSFVNEGITELLNIISKGLINKEERDTIISSYIDMTKAFIDGHREIVDCKLLISTSYGGCMDRRITYYSEMSKLSLLQCNMGISICEELKRTMDDMMAHGWDISSVKNYEIEKWVSYFRTKKDLICNENKVFHSSLHPVKIQGKYGFANNENIIVIKPIYDRVKPFSCDRAKVYKDKKYGYIDRSGTEVVKIIYDEADDFCNDIAKVQLDGVVAFIDINGNIIE